MPSWSALGDPVYQFWLTHTPRGTSVDDPMKVGPSQNELVSYTGDAISMYTHTGTHIDALNHFGLHGEIYKPDIAVLPIGDLFTMAPPEAALAAKMIGAKTVVPIHHSTFPALHGTPAALKEALQGSGIEVVDLKPGGRTAIRERAAAR